MGRESKQKYLLGSDISLGRVSRKHWASPLLQSWTTSLSTKAAFLTNYKWPFSIPPWSQPSPTTTWSCPHLWTCVYIPIAYKLPLAEICLLQETVKSVFLREKCVLGTCSRRLVPNPCVVSLYTSVFVLVKGWQLWKRIWVLVKNKIGAHYQYCLFLTLKFHFWLLKSPVQDFLRKRASAP